MSLVTRESSPESGDQGWEDRGRIIKLGVMFLLAMVLMPILIDGDLLAARLFYILIVLLVLWRGSSIMLLIVLQSYLALNESPQRNPSWMILPAVASVISLALFYLVDSYHLRRILSTRAATEGDGGEPVPSENALATMPLSGATTGYEGRATRVGSWYTQARPWLVMVALVLASVALAWCLLALVPDDRRAGRAYRMREGEMQAMWLMLAMLSTFFIIAAIRGMIVYRGWSPQQASLYLRSGLVSWLQRDLRMVVRRQIRNQGSGSLAASASTLPARPAGTTREKR